jgi:hypothetical protein
MRRAIKEPPLGIMDMLRNKKTRSKRVTMD